MLVDGLDHTILIVLQTAYMLQSNLKFSKRAGGLRMLNDYHEERLKLMIFENNLSWKIAQHHQ